MKTTTISIVLLVGLGSLAAEAQQRSARKPPSRLGQERTAPISKSQSKATSTTRSQTSPNAPSIVRMEQRDAVSGAVIPEGGRTGNDVVDFAVTLAAGTGRGAKIEVDVRPIGEDFDESSARGDSLAWSGDTFIVRRSLGFGSYRWRARAVTQAGTASEWREFGRAGNTDFTIGKAETRTLLGATNFIKEVEQGLMREYWKWFALAAKSPGAKQKISELTAWIAIVRNGHVAYAAKHVPWAVERALIARILKLRQEVLRSRSKKDVLQSIQRHEAWLRSVRAGDAVSVVAQILFEERNAR